VTTYIRFTAYDMDDKPCRTVTIDVPEGIAVGPKFTIETWQQVGVETAPLDLFAGGPIDFEDNPYLDLFKPGKYKFAKEESNGISQGTAEEGAEASPATVEDSAPGGD
jgi:hypothetical protein